MNELVDNDSEEQVLTSIQDIEELKSTRRVFDRKTSGTQDPLKSKTTSSPECLICWNCRLPGHRYQDCEQLPQHIFCYGCGNANVIKPQCSFCLNKSENSKTDVTNSGSLRPKKPISTPMQPIRNFPTSLKH